jgi:hypothetical protein
LPAARSLSASGHKSWATAAEHALRVVGAAQAVVQGEVHEQGRATRGNLDRPAADLEARAPSDVQPEFMILRGWARHGQLSPDSSTTSTVLDRAGSEEQSGVRELRAEIEDIAARLHHVRDRIGDARRQEPGQEHRGDGRLEQARCNEVVAQEIEGRAQR